MSKSLYHLGLILVVTSLGACSQTMSLETPAGEVGCQVYMGEHLFLDRASRWPAEMAKPTADAYCIRASARILQNQLKAELAQRGIEAN